MPWAALTGVCRAIPMSSKPRTAARPGHASIICRRSFQAGRAVLTVCQRQPASASASPARRYARPMAAPPGRFRPCLITAAIFTRPIWAPTTWFWLAAPMASRSAPPTAAPAGLSSSPAALWLSGNSSVLGTPAMAPVMALRWQFPPMPARHGHGALPRRAICWACISLTQARATWPGRAA